MSTKDFTSALRSTTASHKRTVEERMAIATSRDGKVLAPPGASAAAPAKSTEVAAEKSVRENFSMPAADAQLIRELMIRAGRQGVPVSGKSAVVRAALRHLAAASPEVLAGALDAVEPVKHGRK